MSEKTDKFGLRAFLDERRKKADSPSPATLAKRIAEFLQEVFSTPGNEPRLMQSGVSVEDNETTISIVDANTHAFTKRAYTVVVTESPDGKHDWRIEGLNGGAADAIWMYVYERLKGIGVHVNKLGQYYESRKPRPV